MWTDLGRAPRTIDAYARGLAEYLLVCERDGIDPVAAKRLHVAAFVKELSTRPSRRGGNVVVLDSGAGLANATLQQRLVPVPLFYDYLIEGRTQDCLRGHRSAIPQWWRRRQPRTCAPGAAQSCGPVPTDAAPPDQPARRRCCVLRRLGATAKLRTPVPAPPADEGPVPRGTASARRRAGCMCESRT